MYFILHRFVCRLVLAVRLSNHSARSRLVYMQAHLAAGKSYSNIFGFFSKLIAIQAYDKNLTAAITLNIIVSSLILRSCSPSLSQGSQILYCYYFFPICRKLTLAINLELPAFSRIFETIGNETNKLIMGLEKSVFNLRFSIQNWSALSSLSAPLPRFLKFK